MERPTRPAVEHLKEVAWGIFMIDLVFGLLALLFWPHFGTTLTLWLFGSLALAITVLIGGIALLNVAIVCGYDIHERRIRHRNGSAD